jgi:hypothetical protein
VCDSLRQGDDRVTGTSRRRGAPGLHCNASSDAQLCWGGCSATYDSLRDHKLDPLPSALLGLPAPTLR